MWRLLSLVMLSVLVLGCATAYEKRDVDGGFVEDWRSSTELEVRFHHNDRTPVERAHRLAVRRAAELALEGGYRYLEVWGAEHEPRYVTGPQYALVQARFLREPGTDTLDAVEVVRETDPLAGGRLSSRARAELQTIEDG